MEEKIFENNFYIRYRDRGVIIEEYKSGMKLSLELAKEIVAKRKELLINSEFPVFVDARKLVSFDSPARKYMASPDALEGVVAGAIFLDNYIVRMLGNVFLKINKPALPARIFTDKEKGLEWLRTFV